MSIFIYLYLGVYPYAQGMTLVYPYTWVCISIYLGVYLEYVHILMEFYYRVYEPFLGEKIVC